MDITDEEIDRLTESIIGCGIEVHRTLGPGLLESVYRECLCLEMKEAKLCFEKELSCPLKYKDRTLRSHLRIDLLVEGVVIVELKSVDAIHPIHLAQGITYLKLTGCPAGLIMNFNVTALRLGIKRLYHPDRYRKTSSS